MKKNDYPAIKVDSLTKRYGKLKAIDNVSFEVTRGQIVGFLGPNGAGKSTTMRILCGLMAASEGCVHVCGIPVASKPNEAKRCIGYMPERNPLPEDMRVVEYLRYRARLKELSGKTLKSSVDEAMDLCDLNRKARRRVIGTLSKGYRQRVGIADSILGNPDVIIMDEPTIGLDPHQILGIRRLITNLREKMTVMLSSHILPEIEMCCDQIIIINHGRIVANGTSESLRLEFLPQNRYRLTAQIKETTLLEILKDIDKAIKIKESPKNIDSDWQSYILEAPSTLEFADQLTKHINQNHRLKEFACLEPNLEDIFMSATKRSWDETQTQKSSLQAAPANA